MIPRYAFASLISVWLLFGCSAPPSSQIDLSPAATPSGRATLPSAQPTSPAKQGQYADVVGIVDGDTIRVRYDGQTYKVRYVGIDTPELERDGEPAEWMGPEARDRNEMLVAGKNVFLEKDVSETDRYGRLLRYVWVGDTMINGELVRQGYAQAITYPPDVKYQTWLRQLQDEAREDGRGLWAPRP